MKQIIAVLLLFGSCCWATQPSGIEAQLQQLRQLSDAERHKATRKLAQEIRRLPDGAAKESLAERLANLVTEGDPGHGTLQEVATTLAQALPGHPSEEAYATLAQLVRYEHVAVSVDTPDFAAAMKKLETDDASRERSDFTLTDLNGQTWNLRSLSGKVVLVNFLATWCPPCRKELPDLEALQSLRSAGFCDPRYLR